MLPRRIQILTICGLMLLVPAARAQYGPLFSGAGPINRSMGGAAVAAPLDGPGAIYWNPAATSALPSSSMDFGLELLYSPTTLSSRFSPGVLGVNLPVALMSGSDRGDNGIVPLPSIALVYRPHESPFTYGLGIFAVAGYGVNYPASATNPILTPQAPNGLGFGSLFSELVAVQLAPTASVQVTDRLSVGVGPTISMAQLRADPLFIAAPDDANLDLIRTYPAGNHTRFSWGGGFQAGIYYEMENGLQFGASFKSQQWFEDFRFQSADERGRPRTEVFKFELPMISSVGVAYSGIERLLVATDVRYIDFANANGFRQKGFDANGALKGLGFKSIFAVAVGAQYRLTDALSMRAGYTYNENPIDNSESSNNTVSPVVLQHVVYVGASYRVTEAFTVSLAYAHGFENSIDGQLVLPIGNIPLTSVRNSASMDSLMLGATVHFGQSGCCQR